MSTDRRSIALSDEIYARGRVVIPGATQTLAKGTTQFVKGVAPKYLERGLGSHVWDVDGNEYIDYSMGVGPLVLGYAYPAVNEAIRSQLELGTTFSLMHPLEVELAELLVEVVPCAESVRYGKNGADVTAAAIRLARAYTGRDHVVTCGYHGFHDWYIGGTDRNLGVPEAIQELTHAFPYNDITTLEAVFNAYPGQVACVIMEPIIFEAPKPGFLESVKELAQKNGALLVFDEVWTGFRFDLGGAQKMTGVTPDLATYAKAMSNGMPISALVGRREVMDLFDREVFFYLTLGGEALSLAAAVATIGEIRSKGVTEHLTKQGAKLKDGYNQIAKSLGVDRFTACGGFPYRTLVTFDGQGTFDGFEMKSLVQQEMIKRGILWTGISAVSYSHTDDDIERTLDAYGGALEALKRACEAEAILPFLEGEPVGGGAPRPTFFQTRS